MDLDEFMAANTPPKNQSPLKQHEQALRRLRIAGYTGKQIQEYLQRNGIAVSEARISQFFSEMGLRKNSSAGNHQQIPQPTRQEIRRHAPQPIQPPTPTTAPGDDVSPTQMAEFAELARLGRKSTQ